VTLTDAEVPAWWQRLGLPGLLDIHVHFLPEPVMRRVWEQFDRAGPLIGRAWPISYRTSDEERVETLRRLGVRRFSALPYAHRPGIATYLNDWADAFAAAVPEAWSCATFYPEPEAARYVKERVTAGTDLWKVHVQVGDFDLNDPLLDDVWGTLQEAGAPVVVHAGSGPVPNRHTGPRPLRALLERFPRLTVVVAHMGAPEYADFVSIAEDFGRVRLDTTMAFTDFFEDGAAYPAELFPRLRALSDRVLFGSDFPNIPYPFAHQIEALEGLADRAGFDDEWLRAVCWHNTARLMAR
jgi:predicted TIM-barrel fold metal-dependent hydrolase